jgi:hypothetical protein
MNFRGPQALVDNLQIIHFKSCLISVDQSNRWYQC